MSSSRPVQLLYDYTDTIYEPGYHYKRDLYAMYIIILAYMHSYESPKMSLKSYLFTLNGDITKVAISIKPVSNTHFVSDEVQCYLLIMTNR
jgi:hypothetical protein